LRPSIEDECRSILDAAAAHARAGSRGLDVQTSMVHAHPAAALIEASRNADTVVVGSRGLGAVKELLIGSISMQVAVYALSPVVVVREVITQDGTPGGVVVGVDGSELSVEATGFAFEQASQRGLKLTVLHAWDPGGHRRLG
jgi:nucleotide-binding universal stress UspA family protein